MPVLAPDYADKVQAGLGSKLGDAIRARADHYQPQLAQYGSNFSVAGTAAPIAPAPGDPILDFGSLSPNEAWLYAPLDGLDQSPLTDLVEQAVGYRPSAQYSTAGMLARRTIDAGASNSRGLAESVYISVPYFAFNSAGDRIDLFVVNGTGVHPVAIPTTIPDPQDLQPQFEQIVRPRDQLNDADLDHVYARDSAGLVRIPIAERTSTTAPFEITDGMTTAVQIERLKLGRSSTKVPSAPTVPAGPVITHSKRLYDAQSSAPRSNGVAGELVWPDSSMIPADNPGLGLVWGSPTSNCGGRTSRNDCLNCCSGSGGNYVSAAIGTVVGGAGLTGTAIFAGGAAALAIPVTWAPLAAGVVVGGILLGVSWLQGAGCRRDCHRVYDLSSGNALFQNQIMLTAVHYDQDGEPAGYQVEMQLENGQSRTATITQQEAIELVWGGMPTVVEVSDGKEPPIVRLARKPGGDGVYLRSYRDGKPSNNITALPHF